MPMKIAAAEE